MCYTAKDSILSFLVMGGLSIALLIRNKGYDYIFFCLLIIVSLIQLCEYFRHAGYWSADTTGRAIFIVLWLQVVAFAFGMFSYFDTQLTLIWLALFIFVFIIAVFYSTQHTFSAREEGGHLVWGQDGQKGKIMGGMPSWLYMVGLIVPFFIILYYSGWSNVGIWILLAAVIFSIFFTRFLYPAIHFPSLWCYSAIGIAFVAWLVGAYSDC